MKKRESSNQDGSMHDFVGCALRTGLESSSGNQATD